MRYLAVLPETLALVAAFGLYFISLLGPKHRDRVALAWTATAAALAAAAAFATVGQSHTFFAGAYAADALSQCIKGAVFMSLLGVLWLGRDWPSANSSQPSERMIFFLTAAAGLSLLSGAREFLLLYLALEISAYSLYVAVPLELRGRQAEAGLKYLFTGAVASAVFLYGMSLVWGYTGHSNYTELAGVLAQDPPLGVRLGVLFMLASFLFKLSAFPLHFWAPDTYEAAPTPLVAFIATASKAAAAAALARFLSALGADPFLTATLTGVALISMFWGNCAAILQKDAKRLLAYSSIAQAGTMLVAFPDATAEGYRAILFYACMYALMNLAVFWVIHMVGRAADNSRPSLDDFDGLLDRSPLLAVILLLGVLSLGGVPPLVGFTGKWLMFAAAMKAGHPFLVLFGVLNSVISLYYYLVFAKHAWMHEAGDRPAIRLRGTEAIILLAMALLIIGIGFYPAPLYRIVAVAF